MKTAHAFAARLTLGFLPLFAALLVQAQTTYLWTRNSGANSWGTAGNWNPATVAGGADNIADFSTLNIGAVTTVNLDGNRTIGHLRFGDTTSPFTNWVLQTGTGGALTLSVLSGSPSITVTNQTASVYPSLISSQGLIKNGPGTLDLRTNNSISGGITLNGGITQIRNGNGLGTNNAVILNFDPTISGGTGSRLQLENAAVPAGVSVTLVSGTSRRVSLYGGSGNSVWNGNIVLSGPDLTQLYANGSGVTLTINGTITGSSSLLFLRGGSGVGTINGNVNIGTVGMSKTDNGTWVIRSTNNVWGPSAVADGTVRLGAHNALPIGGLLTLGQGSGTTGTFDLGGFDQEIGQLTVHASSTSAAHSIGNSSTTSDSTLIFNGTVASSFRGVIKDVLGSGTRKVNLWVKGGGLTLTTNNTYTGDTLITGGSLALAGAGALSGSQNIIVNTENGFNVSLVAFTVATNQTLAGTGAITGPVTVGSAGTVAPGGKGTVGTLTFNSAVACTDGSFISFDLANTTEPGGTINDLMVVNGDLTLSGIVRFPLNPLATNLANPGTYTLVRYTGALFNSATLVASGPRGNYAFDLSVPGEIRLTISGSAAPADLQWIGDGAPNVWDVGGLGSGAGNWYNGLDYDVFYQGDRVLFGEFSPFPNVSLTGTLLPGALSVNSSGPYSFAGSGSVDGPVGIVKDGTGSLTISNANAYTGTNFINAGKLIAANPQALGATNGPTVVASGSTLDVAGQNLGGETILAQGEGVGGAGALINDGPDQINALRNVILTGPTTLGGSGRFDLRSTANNGFVLQANDFKVTKVGTNLVYLVNNTTNLIDPRLGDIEVREGTLGVAYNITLGNPTNTLTLKPGAGFQITSTGTNLLNKGLSMEGENRFETRGGNNTFIGPVTMTGTNYFDLASGNTLRLEGNLLCNGSLIKTTNTGTLYLTGTNSFTESIVINGGTLAVSNDYALGSAGLVQINYNLGAAAGGVGTVLQLNNANVPSGVAATMLSTTGNYRVAIVGNTGTNYWNGPITLTGESISGFYANSPFSINGTVGISNYSEGRVFFRGNNLGTINGAVTLGTNGFLKTDTGTWVVNSAGHSWGLSIVADGTVRLGANNVLPTNVALRLGQASGTTGTFDLGGYNQTVAGLDVDPASTSTAHAIGNSSTNSDSTVTVAGLGDWLFGGTIRDVIGSGTRKVALTVASGKLILTNDSTYTGPTVISGGTLQLGTNSGARGSVGAGDITNDGILAFDRGGTVIVTNRLSGTGQIETYGTGTILLTGPNACSGTTRISAGKLVYANTRTGSGDILVNDGVSLGIVALNPAGKVITGTLSLGLDANLDFDLGLQSNPTGPLLEVTNLNPSGFFIINISGVNSLLVPGRIPLLHYGSFSNPAGLVAGSLPPRVEGQIEHNAANQTIDLVITSVNAIRWTGALDANWDINSTYNWQTLLAPSAAVYLQPGLPGEAVLFDDFFPFLTNVNLTAPLAPVIATVSNSAYHYTFSGSGKLTGPTLLVKDGTGSLTLNTTNDYFGQSLIRQGTIVASNAAALGSALGSTIVSINGALDLNGQNLGLEPVAVSGAGFNGAGTIVNNSSNDVQFGLRDVTLLGDATLGGQRRYDIRAAAVTDPVLRGNGFNLTKAGPNTVALVSGSAFCDTALGDIDVQQGTLAFEQMISLGISNRLLTLRTNTVLQIYNTRLTNALAKNLNLESYSTLRLTGPNSDPRGTNVLAGTITISDTVIFDAGNGASSFVNSEITGADGIERLGNGLLFLGASNSFAGPLILRNGNTYLANTNGVCLATTNLLLHGTNAAPRLLLLANEQITNDAVITLDGSLYECRFIPNGYTETIAGLVAASGAQARIVEAAADNVDNTPSTVVLNSPAGQTYSFSGYVRDAAGTPAPTNSALSIVKTGAGVQFFSGTPSEVSYSGDTVINEGALAISGSGSVLNRSLIRLGGGTVVFLGGGTRTNQITGLGSVHVDVGTNVLTLAGANLYSGATAVRSGTLEVTGALSSTLEVEAGGALVLGGAVSTLTVSQAVTLGGTTTVKITKAGTSLAADRVNSGATLTQGGTLTVAATGDALAEGDTFDLFDAITMQGAFTTLDLPGLNPGLVWDTSRLAADGTIKVASVAPSAPKLSIALSPSAITMDWTNAVGYMLQSQTNQTGISTNAAQWFTLTNATSPFVIAPVPTSGKVFFRLTRP